MNAWPVAYKLSSAAVLRFWGFLKSIRKPSSTVITDELKMIKGLIYNQPQKRLAFKTQHVMFHPSLKRDALRTRIYVILMALDQVQRL